MLGFSALPAVFWGLLVGIVVAYLTLVELVKRRFERRAGRTPDPAAPVTR